MKSELELRWDGSRRFAERKVKYLEVEYTDQEILAHKNLQQYSKLRHKSVHSAGEKFATEFVLKLLKKRLFSSPAAFALTLEKHVQSIGLASGQNISNACRKQIESVDDDYANDEEYEETSLEALQTASRYITPLAAQERDLLKQLRSYASHAASYSDSKAKTLIQWLKDNIKPGGQWSDRRVIIFTEYRATQKWLHDLLAAEGLAGEDRLKTIYGGMKLEDREKIKAAFQTHPNESPIRILLATDAASEGLNLQNHCWQMIHCEIPWNPNRMEQRNGRVDRHGQKNPEVHIYHFVTKGFDHTRPGQTPGDLGGDLEFLLRAVLKVENIREVNNWIHHVQKKNPNRFDACLSLNASCVNSWKNSHPNFMKQRRNYISRQRISKMSLKLDYLWPVSPHYDLPKSQVYGRTPLAKGRLVQYFIYPDLLEVGHYVLTDWLTPIPKWSDPLYLIMP